jgi:hypothetical protein
VDITFWIISIHFKYISLALETPTNIYKLEHIKYICVEKHTSQSMKNCKYISKLRLWVELCDEIFGGE